MKPRYQTPLTSTWFMKRPGFRRFMAREATSVFVLASLVYLLSWLAALGRGEASRAEFLECARSPWIIALQVILLGGAIYHSVTWFNLTPKIMPLYFAEEKVPDFWAAIFMGYLPWLAVSAVVLWGVLA